MVHIEIYPISPGCPHPYILAMQNHGLKTPLSFHSFHFRFQITSVVLELGTDTQRCAILHWTSGGGESLVPSPTQLPLAYTAVDLTGDNVPQWSAITPRPTAK